MVIEEKKKYVRKKTTRKKKVLKGKKAQKEILEKESSKMKEAQKEILEKESSKMKEAQKEILEMINNLFPGLENESIEEEKKFGRPKVITITEVQKLKACFSVNMNVREALYFSGIKKSTFYNYLKENPDFLDTIEYIKKSTTLKAKFNIQNAINKGSIQDSWKWLEKTEPQEFGNKIGVGNIDMTPFDNITIEIVKNENKDN